MTEISIFSKSLKDYFSSQMLKILFIPLFISGIILYMGFFSLASSGFDSLQDTQIQIQQHETSIEDGIIVENNSTESYTGSGVIDFLLKYTMTSWIVSFLVYTIGIFAIGYLSIFISLIVVGFLTPKILGIIHHRHYNTLDIEAGYGTAFGGIIKLIKSAIIMLILFVVLIPFYFIPLVNIIAINLPIFYLFHKMLQYDVSSTILSKEQYKELYYNNKGTLRGKTILLYSLSLIPFVAFFISTFYIIYLGHTYFTILENKSRND